MVTLPDERLVAEYASGCNEAFDVLLRRHQSRLFSYILSVVKNRDLADDIFQDTFVKAIITIRQGRYSESGRFFPWLTRIAHNRIIDAFRQVKSENVVSTDAGETDMLNRRELAEGNIEDHLAAVQIDRDVRRLVAALPDSQREVLQMRYYQDMSFKEIAAAKGVSINTALGRMHYAVLNLRKMVREKNLSLSR